MLMPLILPQWLILPPPPYGLFLFVVDAAPTPVDVAASDAAAATAAADDKSSFMPCNWWWLAWRLGVIILLCSIIGVVSIGELVLVSLQNVNGISSNVCIKSNVCSRWCNGDVVVFVAWFFGLPCNLHDGFMPNDSIFLCGFVLFFFFVGDFNNLSNLKCWRVNVTRLKTQKSDTRQMSETIFTNRKKVTNKYIDNGRSRYKHTACSVSKWMHACRENRRNKDKKIHISFDTFLLRSNALLSSCKYFGLKNRQQHLQKGAPLPSPQISYHPRKKSVNRKRLK